MLSGFENCPLSSTISKDLGRILKELAIVIAHLLKGLIISATNKARTEGKLKAMKFGHFLKELVLIAAMGFLK
jgi:hypothetical protein